MWNIDKSGSLFKLASYGTGHQEWKVSDNSCIFVKQLIKGFFVCCLITVVLAAMIATCVLPLLGSWILWAIYGMSDNYFLGYDAFILSACVWIALVEITLIFAAVAFALDRSWIGKIKSNVTSTPTGKILAEWWKSKRDKYCIQITFMED